MLYTRLSAVVCARNWRKRLTPFTPPPPDSSDSFCASILALDGAVGGERFTLLVRTVVDEYGRVLACSWEGGLAKCSRLLVPLKNMAILVGISFYYFFTFRRFLVVIGLSVLDPDRQPVFNRHKHRSKSLKS